MLRSWWFRARSHVCTHALARSLSLSLPSSQRAAATLEHAFGDDVLGWIADRLDVDRDGHVHYSPLLQSLEAELHRAASREDVFRKRTGSLAMSPIPRRTSSSGMAPRSTDTPRATVASSPTSSTPHRRLPQIEDGTSPPPPPPSPWVRYVHGGQHYFWNGETKEMTHMIIGGDQDVRTVAVGSREEFDALWGQCLQASSDALARATEAELEQVAEDGASGSVW
eukprot:COSAG01_NODE_952_length_12499_cov_84.157661_14_plen_224_part_00